MIEITSPCLVIKDMKITPKQYAVALYETTQHLSEEEINKIIENFVGVLKKNNDLSLSEKIIGEYQSYCRRKKNIAKVQITSSKRINGDIINALTKKLGQAVEIEQKVDEGLIGGAVIRIGDVLIDGSIKKKLERLRRSIN